MATSFEAKTSEEIRADILRTLTSSAELRGYPLPNVTQDSNDYRLANALAKQLEALHAAYSSLFSRFLPTQAGGEELDAWLEAYGLSRNPPGPSIGKVLFQTSSTVPTAIVQGSELLAPDGSKFLVVSTNTYSNGDSIQVQSDSVGLNTNMPGGTVLRWVKQPPFAYPTANFDAFGAANGTDLEEDESARSRLLDRIRGNFQSCNESAQMDWAQTSSARIEKAFAYGAANGPATSHIAVVGHANASIARSRSLTSSEVLAATDGILAKIPVGIELVVTACEDLPADVTFLLQIPQSAAAIPFGTGGGWIDANPFPTMQGLTPKFCDVSAVTSTTDIVISNCAISPPVTLPPTSFSICYVDKTNFKLYTAKASVLGVTGTGPYNVHVSLDTPFLNIQVGDYIFPAAENMQTYVDAVLNEFANLGPGEKTDQAGLLPQAYRQPRAFEAWDYALGPKFLKAIVNSGKEVYDAEWGHQNGGLKIPPLPSVIKNPPKIFVPRRIAFYPAS